MRAPGAAASLALAACVLAASCGEGRASIGPLQIEVPDGWRVTSRGGDNLQIADGSTGAETGTQAGDATAVFDVYVSSDVDPGDYAEGLRQENVGVQTAEVSVGGYDAVRLSLHGGAVAGRQEAVFVPAWRVRIVYRAAFAGDDVAYLRGRSAFRRSVASIRFTGRPPRA